MHAEKYTAVGTAVRSVGHLSKVLVHDQLLLVLRDELRRFGLLLQLVPLASGP